MHVRGEYAEGEEWRVVGERGEVVVEWGRNVGVFLTIAGGYPLGVGGSSRRLARVCVRAYGRV